MKWKLSWKLLSVERGFTEVMACGVIVTAPPTQTVALFYAFTSNIDDTPSRT